MRKRIFIIIIVLAAFVSTGGALAQDDPRDRIPALLNNVLEINKTGKAISWSNAATGNSGEITITKTY
ncbi:MAG TPA: hypothetical protein ENI79_06460, partial [Rhodospirillales bacterium]|nr:hypothetical protein [Rhodospirillales bacterium]